MGLFDLGGGSSNRTGSTTGHPVNVPLDADRLKVSGGPEGPLNVAPRDGRIADAMRDGHIPFTRSTLLKIVAGGWWLVAGPTSALRFAASGANYRPLATSH